MRGSESVDDEEMTLRLTSPVDAGSWAVPWMPSWALVSLFIIG